MKKIIVFIILISLSIFFSKANSELLIPQEAIRFRVIANSDLESDQNAKKIVSHELENHISNKLSSAGNVDEAREVLKNSVPVFRNIVNDTLKDNNIDIAFDINYGMNYFPEKIYNGVRYKEGDYESLVVTLGSGNGNNWWCVLFPPLCLLEAEETLTNNVEYKFFVKELIDKYF